MENQPQNPEFRINPENFHPCVHVSREHWLLKLTYHSEFLSLLHTDQSTPHRRETLVQ